MAYDKKLKDADPELIVISQACPLFVPLVEEGWVDGVVAEHIAEIYLQQIKSTNIDTLILGCTHYPLLKPLLKAQLENNIKIIDSSVPVAENIFDLGMESYTLFPKILFRLGLRDIQIGTPHLNSLPWGASALNFAVVLANELASSRSSGVR